MKIAGIDLGRIERAAKNKQTPLVIINKEIIRSRYRELQESFENATLYYALKTNPHWRIVELLQEIGAGFEISSEDELNILLRRGVPAEKIIVSNPVKTEACIRASYEAGINRFALDSSAEILKLAEFAPASKVFIRLIVSNEGSQWPLTKKFGVEMEDAVQLLCEAKESGLEPYGLTFHVGSQCIESDTWVKAIEKSKQVWDQAQGRGITLRMLNIGGGFPVKYEDDSPSIEAVAEQVRTAIEDLFLEDVDIFVEPGRVLVGEAGVLVATVIGKAVRNEEKWLYLDVGVFNGLMESIGGIKYSFISAKDGKPEKWVIAGPSCDSFDVIQNDVLLPELDVGDKVYILSAGAYTTAYASKFDGIRIPRTTFF